MELLCPWEPARFLIFSSNVPTLLYYSHFVAILAALIFSIVLFSQRKSSISVKLFLLDILMFIAWAVIDVLLWASNRPDLVMFYWSMQVLLEVFIYATAFYFAYTFVTKRDLKFWPKVMIVAIMAPVIYLLPTDKILPGIDVSYCNAVESLFLFYYVYLYEILLSIGVLFFSIREIMRSPNRKKEIGLFALGILIYLFAFSSGNIIGSISEDWALAQIGLFGMPIFIAFLAYAVIKFKSFNIKLISSQALVVTIWLLTLAILFIRQIENVRIVVIFTLALFTVLGYQLIKSVKHEIVAREALAKANIRLKELDKQKTEFISFATHQLRSPITSIKGNASIILEGDAGRVPPMAREIVQTIYTSIKTMAAVVEDYLNVSRIELGTMKYDLRDMDFKQLAQEVVNEQKPTIEAKGLKWSFTVEGEAATTASGATSETGAQTYKIKADPDKFKQVLMNIVDNSVKYTPNGSLQISLEKDKTKGTVCFKVADTGVGIDSKVLPLLFQKFSRSPKANEANIHGTGLGLFIAKEIMNAHGGRIWAESDGEGKGSRFYVELPEVR